ncbi:MAG: hypothetical protein NC925_04945 [Candidatus Omnitrophica bacterium]|nr:hypothetical protein [Candidatus Omnitrophota bacterium]
MKKNLWLLLLLVLFVAVDLSFAQNIGSSGAGAQFFTQAGSSFYDTVRTIVFGGIGRTAILLLAAVGGAMAFFMQKWPFFIFIMLGLAFYLLLPTMMGGLETAVGMIL